MEHTTQNAPRRVSSAGFIKIILLVIIGLIILGYFGLNIKDILASPIVKENLAYAWELAKTLWANWLQAPAQWVWEHLLKFLWNLFIEGLSNLKTS